MFSWFSRVEDKIFAKQIAENIERRLPPSVAKSRKNLSVERLGDIFESILGEAKNYSQANKPNLFRKAGIANTFRWELKNYGYPEEFINEITKALVIYMAKK